MKKNVLLILLLLIETNANSQWVAQISGTTNLLKSAYFISNDTGYATGISGTILKTINGGVNWNALSNTIGNNTITSAYFSNADTGFAVSACPYKTTNGGVTWSPTTVYCTIFAVAFINHTKGFAVGCDMGQGEPIICQTNNGGSYWSLNHAGGSGNGSLQSICFVNSHVGYAAGGGGANGGLIYKTVDGQNWFPSALGSSLNFVVGIYFTDSLNGYAVGNYGVIMKTTDAGVNWVSLVSGTTVQLEGVYFTDALTGYVVGFNGLILKTTDGGNSWIQQACPTTENLFSVRFTDYNTGYVVGASGTILKTINGGVGISESTSSCENISIFPNPATNQLNITINNSNFISAQITITNIIGEKVLPSVILSLSKETIDISTLSKGMYFAETIVDGKKSVMKIIKE